MGIKYEVGYTYCAESTAKSSRDPARARSPEKDKRGILSKPGKRFIGFTNLFPIHINDDLRSGIWKVLHIILGTHRASGASTELARQSLHNCPASLLHACAGCVYLRAAARARGGRGVGMRRVCFHSTMHAPEYYHIKICAYVL